MVSTDIPPCMVGPHIAARPRRRGIGPKKLIELGLVFPLGEDSDSEPIKLEKPRPILPDRLVLIRGFRESNSLTHLLKYSRYFSPMACCREIVHLGSLERSAHVINRCSILSTSYASNRFIGNNQVEG